jgi:hypothetical protein
MSETKRLSADRLHSFFHLRTIALVGATDRSGGHKMTSPTCSRLVVMHRTA